MKDLFYLDLAKNIANIASFKDLSKILLIFLDKMSEIENLTEDIKEKICYIDPTDLEKEDIQVDYFHEFND